MQCKPAVYVAQQPWVIVNNWDCHEIYLGLHCEQRSGVAHDWFQAVIPLTIKSWWNHHPQSKESNRTYLTRCGAHMIRGLICRRCNFFSCTLHSNENITINNDIGTVNRKITLAVEKLPNTIVKKCIQITQHTCIECSFRWILSLRTPFQFQKTKNVHCKTWKTMLI